MNDDRGLSRQVYDSSSAKASKKRRSQLRKIFSVSQVVVGAIAGFIVFGKLSPIWSVLVLAFLFAMPMALDVHIWRIPGLKDISIEGWQRFKLITFFVSMGFFVAYFISIFS